MILPIWLLILFALLLIAGGYAWGYRGGHSDGSIEGYHEGYDEGAQDAGALTDTIDIEALVRSMFGL